MKQKREIKICPVCGNSNFHLLVRSHEHYCNNCKSVFVNPVVKITDIAGKKPKYLKKKEVEVCDVLVI